MAGFKHLRVEQRDHVTVIHLLDSHLLDRVVLNELYEELTRFLNTFQPPHVLVSFGYVLRFGTEAVNCLLRTRKCLAAYGGELRLCDMQAGIHEIFKVLQLEGTVFSIHGSTAEALTAFA